MNYHNIENILAKKITGEASSRELAILDQWRMESVDNQLVYDEYALLWNASSNYEPTEFNPDFELALASHLAMIDEDNVEIQEVSQKNNNVKTLEENKTSIFSIRRITSIAAIFVLGIAAIFLFNNSSTSISSANGVQFASLEDGSLIWLGEGSSIKYKKGFGTDHRNLTLDGKAFFDITRNETLPFNITEQDLTVSVLGTSFTVDGARDEVSVVTGEVQVSTESDKVVLNKNEKSTLSENKLQVSASSDDSGMWRNSNLSFDSSPLTQVVADINMFHGNKLKLDEKSIDLACPFTSGGLASESLENIIKILEKSYNLTTSTSTKGIIKLTVTKCD